jgi:hypothetical protein
MKWNAKDVNIYDKEKAYIDTAIIPLFPLSFDESMKQSASQAEFITLLTQQLEKQFKGRIFLFPPFTYLSGEVDVINRLHTWTSILEKTEFKYVFYLSSDVFWKTVESELSDQLIWLPSIPLEHMEEKHVFSLIEGQVNQFLNIIVQKWQNG